MRQMNTEEPTKYKTQPTSQIQRDYVDWFDVAKANGLKDIKFFVGGNLMNATLDGFIQESNAIDEAIRNGRTSPIPKDL
jgi:hypothetical protein